MRWAAPYVIRSMVTTGDREGIGKGGSRGPPFRPRASGGTHDLAETPGPDWMNRYQALSSFPSWRMPESGQALCEAGGASVAGPVSQSEPA